MEWLYDLKMNILGFLDLLKGDKPGYFRYSLSGDLYGEEEHWGLGQAVFASKIYYMLGQMNHRDELVSFVKSFQDANGEIFDSLVAKKAKIRNFLSSIRHFEFYKSNRRDQRTRRAETRQSFAALSCLDSRPNLPYLSIPYTKAGIKKYIDNLDWSVPWSSGSHFSHLMFFLKTNHEVFRVYGNDTEELINYAITCVNKYQSAKEGCWFKGSNVSARQKINGSMKVLTGMAAAKRFETEFPKKLIELCLKSINDEHACDNFNIVYVLYFCSQLTDYKSDEIKAFCRDRLSIYKKHYWPKYGGFSFYPERANSVYYGAKISKGLPEPDIHGTVLFLWGITLISKILEINNLNLNVPIT